MDLNINFKILRIMENCLVTKLKAIVNNDNLPYFDTVVISVNADTKSDDLLRFGLSSVDGKPIKITIMDSSKVMYHTDNTFTQVYGNSATIIGSTTDDNKQIVDVSEGNYKIHIERKANIKSIYIGAGMSINLINLQSCYELTEMSARVGILKCVGDCANLKDCTKLTELQLGGSDCYGNITSLANLVNLTILDIRTSRIDSPNHKFDDFLDAVVQVGGRSSGTMKIYSNGNLGIEGVVSDFQFYPVSSEHPRGWEML